MYIVASDLSLMHYSLIIVYLFAGVQQQVTWSG